MSKSLAPHPHTASRLALSELAPGAMQSEIRAMSVACEQMGGINLAQGICDTPVPMPVETAAIAAIVAGHIPLHAPRRHHPGSRAPADCREAPPRFMVCGNAMTLSAIEVMVACGATAGLHAAAMALLNPGDEVLVFEPFYGYHVSTLKSMRVKPVLVALAEPDWVLDTDALRAAITPRTPRHSRQHSRQPPRQSLLPG